MQAWNKIQDMGMLLEGGSVPRHSLVNGGEWLMGCGWLRWVRRVAERFRRLGAETPWHLSDA